MSEEYAVVTTIRMFRHRYVIPMSELQKQNTDYEVKPEWAMDMVTMDEIKEFSQEYLCEQITDGQVMGEEEILQLFDADNKYLSGWSTEKKLAWIRDWKENWSQTNSK